MGIMYFCDLCGKDIEDPLQIRNKYVLPYFIDDGLDAPSTKPEQDMNLCMECAEKIRNFCKTLDSVNGFKYEGNYDDSGQTQ